MTKKKRAGASSPTTSTSATPTMSKAEVVLHPVRLRIVQRLAAVGEATPSAIGAALSDVAPASLYRHLNKLVAAELVEVVSERKVGGAVERVFALVQQRASLTQKDIQRATPADHSRWFMTFALGLFDKFERYLARTEKGKAPNFEKDGVGYHTLPLWLSDKEFASFAKDLNRIVLDAAGNKKTRHRKLRSFSTVILPEVDVVDDE